MLNGDLFKDVRREFMNYLRYNKGYPDSTCCNYNSDLNIWSEWLGESGGGWTRCRPPIPTWSNSSPGRCAPAA